MNNNIGIEIDTNTLISDSTKINNLVVELETKINNYFKKLNNIPNTKEWFGNNAELYARTVIQDKEDFLKYLNGIKDISKEMQNFAINLEEKVNSNQNSVD